MSGSKFMSEEESAKLDAHVERVIKALGDVELIALIRRLREGQAGQRKLRPATARVPFGLHAEADTQGFARIDIQPFVPCDFTHLVMTHEASTVWGLENLYIANYEYVAPGAVRIRGTEAFPTIPLELFSIRFMHDDEFAAVQRFRLPRADPSMHVRLNFRVKEELWNGGHARAKTPLRGVLWAEIVEP